MKNISNIALFSFFFIALLDSVSWAQSSSNSSSHQSFIQCLENYSSPPSNPISAVLYTPDNSSYSSVLQAYIRNLRFNESTTPKPQLIITALHVSHIQAAIVCAKLHGVQMKIRSGGHDYEGVSYVSNVPDFFILDMFNFRAINVSIEDESAWVEVGAILGEVYYRIAERSNTHGFPAGVCPSVGVGGYISGGGYGNMMRKYGLSVDNIIDAQIIDVNGRILNRKSMGEDLFWAITGGGGASYGVVLSYKIKLVRVPNIVTVFRVARRYNENFTDLVYKYQLIADKLPEELFIRLNLNVVNNTNRATFVALFLGNSQELISLMNKNFPELALNQTDCEQMSWVESVLYWTNLPIGTVSALLNRAPPTLTYLKRKSDYLKKPIPKEGLDSIFKKMVELQFPILVFNPYGGKMAEIPSSEKPFPHRAGNIAKLQYATNWNENGAEAANHYLNLTRTLFDYMTPFVSMNPREAFLNYRDLDIGINHNGRNSYLEGAVYGVKYFKENFNRLVKIKTKVDPHNFFRNEQSIPVLPWRK
ncbi:hypothetical protein RD792_003824 [Penstemon davidsonii]|uniref:FAD-binding PCMH-type domain-containing protein n=1 Tax=Penstemon davidsonii TaxID=160366 RepID=A0ABR0DFS0_9LAMI|nr:hypothetical protein RD792_003824 [Penstemon davidsonii]